MGALRQIGGRASVDFLVRTLEHTSDNRIKLHAIPALANSRVDEAVYPLIHLLGDRSPMVRTAAADGLADIGDHAAIPAIEASLRRTWNPFIRPSIKLALERLRER
jgi:HEAT repeat protein